MILVAGLTPAWQQILSFRHFELGEVNRAYRAVVCASGKVLNVGTALYHLGVDTQTICPAGGFTGKRIQADFKQLGIPIQWIATQAPIRTCTTILDESTGKTTELVENSNPLTIDELAAYSSAFLEEARSAQVIVLTGSLPEGTPPTFFRQLLEPISAKTVLDIRGQELLEALSQRPFLVKPNREELAKTVNRKIDTESDLLDAMAEMRQRGAEWVVVSQGSATLLALGPDGLCRVEPPQIDVVNPIGCGDCLAAGIAAGIHQNVSMRQALEIGVRAAAENAQSLLPARNLTRLV